MGKGTGPEPLGRDGRPSQELAADRRDGIRFPILGELSGTITVIQPMGITEIGTGGVQVETTFPLHLDSIRDFRFELGGHSVVVKGRVTHCSVVDVEQELVRYRSGIQFVDAPERAIALIAALLRSVADSGELRT